MNFGLPKVRKPRCTLPQNCGPPDHSDSAYAGLEGPVTISVNGHEEVVQIDAQHGPIVYGLDGSKTFFELKDIGQKSIKPAVRVPRKTWTDYTSSEKRVLVHLAAKKNYAMRSLLSPELMDSAEKILAQCEEQRQALESEVRQLADRCTQEGAREPIFWKPIAFDTVLANHDKKSAGVFYGLEFPWTSKLLEAMGPSWLTAAFHRAGTLEKSNRVTELKIEPQKVDAGNNAGKFLFSVKYARQREGLHQKLFAKVPHAMTKETKNDRLSSSVLKQPMDFYEINTYRVAETLLPMPTPKFYYGDISNETSNYILITERIPYSGFSGKAGPGILKPFDIEGPYDKCKDYELKGSGKEYYTLIFQMAAKLAAADKTGRMGSVSFKASNFGLPPQGNSFADWGLNPVGPSGGPAEVTMSKLNQGIKFFSKTASMMFAPYVSSKEYIDKFTKTMMTFSAYTREIDYWKHLDSAYIALGHANLNVDNAYYWRNDEGRLQCGVLDWGGFGASCVGHKLYWYINCAEWENNKQHLQFYLDTFVDTYRDAGGPKISRDLLEKHVKLTCLQNLMTMVSAVPNCLQQIPEKDWESIRDRFDPRITSNLGGKSTLRTTLRAMDNGLRFIEELGVDKLLESWIQEVWVGELGQKAKTDKMIFSGDGNEEEVLKLAGRCERERERAPILWKTIAFDHVLNNHSKKDAGIFYGLEFPWTSKMLAEMGPQWLTTALQRAGTLEKGNRVTELQIEEQKVDAGNNAGKFLFNVKYERQREGLHQKLFAKVPHAMTKETKNDRLSSSVLKQPMDFLEINTYRVAETLLPMQTPKFYYGDISNETSNYILITERIPYSGFNGKTGAETLEPFEIEGPYDKCKDYDLKGSGKEYYTLIFQMAAKIAAADKTGRMGSEIFKANNFGAMPKGTSFEEWGVNLVGPSGGPAQTTMSKLKHGINFFSRTASVIFAPYVCSEEFIAKFTKTMMTFSAYTREIDYWKHRNPDYIALGHSNLNVDNAYYWRDTEGKLDCGVLDWGGFGATCVGHKLYWYINCAEWENNKANLLFYCDTFVKTYRDEGGPQIASELLEKHIKLTCLGNLMTMVSAVPDCLRQLPEKEWETIKNEMDPRITANLGGKSTLRTTLKAMDNGLRFIEELETDQLLESWIRDVWVGELGQTAKTDDMIFNG